MLKEPCWWGRAGITITEADVKEAGFLKFSQMLASMTDVCTMHMVLVSPASCRYSKRGTCVYTMADCHVCLDGGNASWRAKPC